MKTEQNYIGIDISKARLDLAALQPEREWSLPNDAAGLGRLLAQLAQWPKETVVVCEASGGYERDLIAALQKAGCSVALLNPRQVRDYARAWGLLAKTDRIDARVIARYGAPFAPAPLAPPSAARSRLRELVERHRQLTCARVAEANQGAHLQCADLRRLSRTYLRLLDRQLATVDALIAKELREKHRVAAAALTAVPGIGVQSAALLLAELPELGRATKGQIAALARSGSL